MYFTSCLALILMNLFTILCDRVHLTDPTTWDVKVDKYAYCCLGGNNHRVAILQVLQECKDIDVFASQLAEVETTIFYNMSAQDCQTVSKCPPLLFGHLMYMRSEI